MQITFMWIVSFFVCIVFFFTISFLKHVKKVVLHLQSLLLFQLCQLAFHESLFHLSMSSVFSLLLLPRSCVDN